MIRPPTSWQARPTRSAPGDVARDLPLELGEEASDDGQVERVEDGLLRLASEEEVEGTPNENGRVLGARRESVEVDVADGHGVAARRAIVRDIRGAEPAVVDPLAANIDLNHRRRSPE